MTLQMATLASYVWFICSNACILCPTHVIEPNPISLSIDDSTFNSKLQNNNYGATFFYSTWVKLMCKYITSQEIIILNPLYFKVILRMSAS